MSIEPFTFLMKLMVSVTLTYFEGHRGLKKLQKWYFLVQMHQWKIVSLCSIHWGKPLGGTDSAVPGVPVHKASIHISCFTFPVQLCE